MKDSKPVESFETSNKEFRITQKEFVLMEETNYSVKVRSIRKNDDGDKFSEYSQAADFVIHAHAKRKCSNSDEKPKKKK